MKYYQLVIVIVSYIEHMSYEILPIIYIESIQQYKIHTHHSTFINTYPSIL